MTVMMMQVNDPIPDPMEMRSDVPPDLVRIITKALQKDKLNRYQTADELLTELNQAQLTFDST
ncbi:MAG: hypothetical protein GWO08_01150, partial [Gammaproteobacteria bacterium]|nr:hypothetical protein [Gammaproteobacteria bacterium]